MMKIVIVIFLCLATLQARRQEVTVTLVTALWPPSAQQHQGLVSYEQSLTSLDALLQTEENMIIFGDEELMNRVNQKRSSSNTVFVLKTLSELKEFPSSKMVDGYLKGLKLNNFDQYQKYEKEPQFYSSQQAAIMYSKMALLNEALSYDTFASDYIYWIDPDINNNPQYNKPQSFNRQHNILRKFSQQLQLPFIVRTANLSSTHMGFRQLQKHPEVNTVAILDWFGGRVQAIATVANAYQNTLRASLHQGDYFSHQTLFSLIVQRCPKLVTQINSLIPGGLYTFEISNFIARPIREARYMRLLDAGSSLKFSEKQPLPTPIFKPTVRYSETFYEYELLVSRVTFRLHRTETFLCMLLLSLVSAKLSSCLSKSDVVS